MAPRFGQGSSPLRLRASANSGVQASANVVLGVLLAVSLVITTLYVREGEEGPVHAVQQTVSGLFAPLKVASGSISAVEQNITGRLEDLQADPQTLSALREQNEQLRQLASALEEYRQEAQRLEGLLEMRTTYEAQGVPARVLSRSVDAWNRVVTIDAGSEDGVHAGLPVMGPAGLVGQVVSTTAHASDVRLLRDSNSGVAVVIQSNREEGIVHGSIEGLLYLEDVSDEVEVEPGDVLVSSGLGGGYFRGIMVGTVLKVEGEAGATTRKIIVEPNEQADPLEEVYVVTSMTSDAAEPEKTEEEASEYVDMDGDGVPETYVGGQAGAAESYGTDSAAYGAAQTYDSAYYGYTDAGNVGAGYTDAGYTEGGY